MVDAKIIFHPIRLRIVQVLIGEKGLTTAQIRARLNDVPIATLYRHIAQLTEHKIIEVVSERRVRGASEHTYRLAANLESASPDDLQNLSPNDLLATFIAFCTGIIGEFEHYLRKPKYDLERDLVHFHQLDFWASDADVEEFRDQFGALLDKLVENKPSPERRLRVFTSTLMPRDQNDEKI